MKALKKIILAVASINFLLFAQGCYTTFGTIRTDNSSTALYRSDRQVYADNNELQQNEAYVESDTVYEDYGQTIINNFYINNPAWRPYFDPFWDDPYYWDDTRISVWIGINTWDPYWWDPYYSPYPPVVVVNPWRHHWHGWGWWRYPTIVYYDPWYTPWFWDPYYTDWGWYWGSGNDRNFKRRDWDRRHPIVRRGADDNIPVRGGTGFRQPRVPNHSEPQVRHRTVHRRQIQVRDNNDHPNRSRKKFIRRGNRRQYTNEQSSHTSNRARTRHIIRRSRTYKSDNTSQSSSSSRKVTRVIRRQNRSNSDHQSTSQRHQQRQIRRTSRESHSSHSSGYGSGRSYRSSRSSGSSHNSSPSYRSRSSSSRSSSHSSSSKGTRIHRSRRR